MRLQTEHLARRFESNPPIVALNSVDLTIETGEFVAIVGPSGSGKSTLLNLLGLLDRPSGGNVLLDGLDTGNLGERQRSAIRADSIGFVFQAFHLLGRRTVLENVALGTLYTDTPNSERYGQALHLLENFDLGDRHSSLPVELSAGQQQRVALARALTGKPGLLLCDEPTGNLDTANGQRIVSSLRQVSDQYGVTVLLVTHDPGVASQADRVLQMQDGAVLP